MQFANVVYNEKTTKRRATNAKKIYHHSPPVSPLHLLWCQNHMFQLIAQECPAMHKKKSMLLLLNVVLVSSVYKACVYVIQLNVPKILLSPTDSTGWKFMMIVDLRIYDIGITWVHSQKHCYFQLNIHSTVYPTSLLLTTFFDKEGGIRHTYTK